MPKKLGKILIENYPLGNLHCISNLIEIEFPLLIHFKDSRGKDILFYLVDIENDRFSYLSFKVQKLSLAQYLKGGKPLREIIVDVDERDFFYLVQVAENAADYSILSYEDLTEDILPPHDSFYEFDFPKGYDEYENVYNDNYYITDLRNRALIFTLKPKDSQFLSSVGLDDADKFMSDINKSYKSYARQNFFERFKNEITDANALNRTAGKVVKMSDPRIVHLKYGSFEIGLSADTIARDEEIKKEFIDWKNEILDEYKRDVVEVDYDNESQLNSILEKYSPQARKEIYAPFLRTVSNKKYTISVTDKKRNFSKVFKESFQKSLDIIIPEPRLTEFSDIPKRKLLNIVLEVKEGEDVTKIKRKDIQTGLLFSTEIDKTSFEIEKLDTDGLLVEFKKPIRFNVEFRNNVYTVHNEEFSLEITTDDKNLFELLIGYELYVILNNYITEKNRSPNYRDERIDLYVSNFLLKEIPEDDLPY